jgi:hypothetical protein
LRWSGFVTTTFKPEKNSTPALVGICNADLCLSKVAAIRRFKILANKGLVYKTRPAVANPSKQFLRLPFFKQNLSSIFLKISTI